MHRLFNPSRREPQKQRLASTSSRRGEDTAALDFEPAALPFLGWALLGGGLEPRQSAGAPAVIGAIVALGSAKR